MAEAKPTQQLTWTCTVCGNPIADGTGSIFIPYEEIRGALRADCEPRWITAHFDCDDRDGYSIDVERIRTHEQALAWTAHLMGKRWVADTNWLDVVGDKAVAL